MQQNTYHSLSDDSCTWYVLYRLVYRKVSFRSNTRNVLSKCAIKQSYMYVYVLSCNWAKHYQQHTDMLVYIKKKVAIICKFGFE